MDAKEASEAAKKRLEEALGKKANATIDISQEGEEWKASVEIVEEEHMPSKFDLVGVYEVKLDKTGKITSWSRKETRQRG